MPPNSARKKNSSNMRVFVMDMTRYVVDMVMVVFEHGKRLGVAGSKQRNISRITRHGFGRAFAADMSVDAHHSV